MAHHYSERAIGKKVTIAVTLYIYLRMKPCDAIYSKRMDENMKSSYLRFCLWYHNYELLIRAYVGILDPQCSSTLYLFDFITILI